MSLRFLARGGFSCGVFVLGGRGRNGGCNGGSVESSEEASIWRNRSGVYGVMAVGGEGRSLDGTLWCEGVRCSVVKNAKPHNIRDRVA